MTIVCPRCATPNTRWDKRCTACWGQLPKAGVVAEERRERVAREQAATERERERADAHHAPLAEKLGLEVAHVAALADAGIETVEHVAESLPERIAHALRRWAHLDPEAIVARARDHVRAGEPHGEYRPDPAAEPDPPPWWKTT